MNIVCKNRNHRASCKNESGEARKVEEKEKFVTQTDRHGGARPVVESSRFTLLLGAVVLYGV